MALFPVQLLDARGNRLPDRILLEPRPDGLMHPAVAVANVLRIWALASPAQCRAAFPEIVREGKLHRRPGGSCAIAIDGKEFEVISIECRDGVTRPERVLSGARAGQPHEENYWILNPGVAGDDRLAVQIRRKYLADLVEDLNRSARTATNRPVHGLRIRLQ